MGRGTCGLGRRWCVLAAWVLAVSLGGSAMAEEALDARPAYLLLDARVAADVQHARLMPGAVVKHTRNPLFGEDKAWEPRFDNVYANVVFDDGAGLYRCWYSPLIIDERTTYTPPEQRPNTRYLDAKPTGREMAVCYASSRDGLTWEKPELGLVEFEGSKANNIVFRGPHGAGVFEDTHDADEARRYKMVFKAEDMAVAFSADGLHWGEGVPCVAMDAVGDTHNNALWAPELGKYVGFTRLWGREPRVRQVGRTESADFVNWTKAEVALQGLETHLQTYSMPVFRYADVYLGLPAIFDTQTDRTHTELAWSPDTVTWHRIAPGTPLIANAAKEGAYDWGCAYAAAYPVFLPDEIRLYYGGSNGRHTSWRDGFLCLATLRVDGFAGYEPEDPDVPGVITTAPVPWQAGQLWVSADVESGGAVRLTVKGEGGTAWHSEPVTSSATREAVRWTDGKGPDLAGKPCRLTFELAKAKLYAFGFTQ